MHPNLSKANQETNSVKQSTNIKLLNIINIMNIINDNIFNLYDNHLNNENR